MKFAVSARAAGLIVNPRSVLVAIEFRVELTCAFAIILHDVNSELTEGL